jgi:hypothetical protein
LAEILFGTSLLQNRPSGARDTRLAGARSAAAATTACHFGRAD